MYNKKTYTFYADCVEIGRVRKDAVSLHKWHGPIYPNGLQVIMCSDEKSFFEMLKLCLKYNVKVYGKKQTNVHKYEFFEFTTEEIQSEINRLGKKLHIYGY